MKNDTKEKIIEDVVVVV